MVWNDPPKFIPDKPKKGKRITPEQLASSGSEHASQVALFSWSADNCGQYPMLKFMHAIPNGGLRDVRTATSLKAEGVKAGVLDIFLPYPTDKWSGLYLEMKWGKNKVTAEQKEFIDFIGKYYNFRVCYNWMEARDKIIEYLEGRL